MGQSIGVLLYGTRLPHGVDFDLLLDEWEQEIGQKREALEAKLRGKTNSAWGLAHQAYVPMFPHPHDAEADELIGFYVCRGHYDDAESHRFPAMTFAEMRAKEPTAGIVRRCRKRWSRFARWARAQGVEFGRPRIWRTRTEVA